MKHNKKPARWEFLNELDGRPTDTTPIRRHTHRLAPWEIILYTMAGLLWIAALVIAVMERDGDFGLALLGLSIFTLRYTIFELSRGKRCKEALLGTIESFTRRQAIRKSAKYPVIRFEVNGAVYFVHGVRPTHPATLGNEEWVRYNPCNPADAFVSSESNPKWAVGLTLVTACLGVAFLILELN